MVTERGLTSPKFSLEQLARAVETNETIIAVHYACESIVTPKDHPPQVAGIAIYDLATREVSAFSRTDAPKDVAVDAIEIDLLDRFFKRLSAFQDSLVIHWNMNRPEYGFEALISRFRHLTKEPESTSIPARRVDVDDIFVEHFGENYAPHGRLLSMANLNNLDVRSTLSGRDEAARFVDKDWSALTRSCASKAKIIGDLFVKMVNGM